MRFKDRREAGRLLGQALAARGVGDAVVLGLVRGGVPVAFEVARTLAAPLDVIVVRKLGVPFQPELAMGAIGEDGVRILNPEVLRLAGVSERELAAVEETERRELERQARLFREDRPRLSLENRIALVVDDGIATGSTARAACQVARAHGAAGVVMAVPVLARSSLGELAGVADDVVYLEAPHEFFAVGQWYRSFSQTSDGEVVDLLRLGAANEERVVGGNTVAQGSRRTTLEIPVGSARLTGDLEVPEGSRGTVVFAHGSGSSRHSPRNKRVAAALNEAGLATLLTDLLTEDEAADRSRVFDIELLARRLLAVTARLPAVEVLPAMGVGYFGASTGAGAALAAAADPGARVSAIVSRGGRPDLAGALLAKVRAPTLLIVGAEDRAVLEMNRQAQEQLVCENRLEVVPGATHLFEEPGALERVAALARDWFLQHPAAAAQPAS